MGYACLRRPGECQNLDQIREEIDKIDDQLVDLIAQRFEYVDQAWKLKLNTPVGAVVPWRIEQVVERVKKRARKRSLSPELVGTLWREIIGYAIRYEEKEMGARELG